MQYRWKVVLKGDPFALSVLAWNMPSGDVRVLDESGATFLVGRRFDPLDGVADVRAETREVLATINLAFGILHGGYTPVEAEGTVIEREADGTERSHVPGLAGTIGGGARMGVLGVHRGQPTTPSLSELVFRAVESREHLRAAFVAFNTKPTNFSDLYIAYETVRRGVSPSNDYKDILVLEWANQDELDRFHDTARYYRHGLPRRPMKRPEMPLEEATGLIRRLLTHWAEKPGAEP